MPGVGTGDNHLSRSNENGFAPAVGQIQTGCALQTDELEVGMCAIFNNNSRAIDCCRHIPGGDSAVSSSFGSLQQGGTVGEIEGAPRATLQRETRICTEPEHGLIGEGQLGAKRLVPSGDCSSTLFTIPVRVASSPVAARASGT